MLRRLLFAAGVTAAATLVAGPVLATNQYVAIRNSQYTPKTLTIRQGDTVSWSHLDSDEQHSVTAAAGQAEKFDSSPNCPPTCLERGDTYRHTFTHAGTFIYYCHVHCPDNGCTADGMRGTIVVRAFTATTPQPTAKPTPTPVPVASNGVSVTTPAPSETPTPTPSESASPPATEAPSASAVAAPKSKTTSSGMGLALGLAITGAAIAALGGSLLFVRFRRPPS